MDKSKKIAIIGSSPISLFEAIYQAKKGNKVTIFESLDRVGGAWASIQHNDDLNLEIGCHIWDVNKKTYLFIEKFLGEKLNQLKPYPIIIYKKKAFPYDWKNNILLLKTIKHDFKGYISGKKFVKPVLKSRKYKYPKGGSKQLLDKLLLELSALNVEIRLGEEINLIKQLNDSWQLVSNGTVLNFDKLILTSLSGLDKIELKNQNIIPDYKPTTFYHFHLLFEGRPKKNTLSYVRVMGHKFIHRISDISSYSNTPHQVISVGIFKEKTNKKTDKEIVDEIKRYMKNMGWIDEDYKILEYYSNEFNVKIMDHFQIKELKKIKDLSVLRSTNFIFGLGNNIERWSKVIFT